MRNIFLTRRHNIVFFSIIICLLFSALTAFAAPGDLDQTFGSSGKVITPVSINGNDVGRSVALQPDGKTVVAGYSFNGANFDFAVARYNADGSLDTTFNGTGKVVTPIGNFDDEAFAVAVQGDGKIIVGGFSSNGTRNNFAVVRYNPGGALDTTFNGNGKAVIAVGSVNDEAYSLGLQADGRIIVVGYSNNGANNDFSLIRLNTNGALDTNFGTNGKVVTPVGNGNDFAFASAVQTDDKIVVGGVSNGANADFALVRYNSDGSLDTSFNGTGKVITPIGAGDDYITALTVQPDGKIVAAGFSTNTTNDFALARYNANGSLDTSFNGTGKVITPIGTLNDEAFAVKVQPDGKIMAAGLSNNGANTDFALVRYTANGALDTSFDGDGKLTTAIGNGDEAIYGLALQADGKIVAAGVANNGANDDFALARYGSGVATITVTNLNDSGAGSLRQAIIDANNSPNDDIIGFQSNLSGTITLTSGELLISSNITINGTGSDVITVSGNNASRVFHVYNPSSSIIASINGLKISDGLSNLGGGIYNQEATLFINNCKILNNQSTGSGGGIVNTGSVYLANSLVSQNVAAGGPGGGINQIGTISTLLEITNSTISYNQTNGTGAIFNSQGTLNVRNSTVSYNTSGYGIFNQNGTLLVLSSTVSNNTGTGINYGIGGGGGEGISIINSTVVNNSLRDIVAFSTVPIKLRNSIAGLVTGQVVSQGYNLFTNIIELFPAVLLPTDQITPNLGLAPLGNYGGSTQTVALLPNSPALNSGDNTNQTPTDQRGVTRIIGGTADRGAFENNITITPTNQTLPNGGPGTPYSITLAASRASGSLVEAAAALPETAVPFTFSLISGTLPAGLTLELNGTISGTPAVAGTFNFAVKATDSDGIAGANQYSITVGCSYAINPTSQSFTENGGSGNISVTTSPGCAWTAQSNAAWITITNGSSGTGNGTVSFTVQPNTDLLTRTGTITVAGLTFTVNQARGCTYVVSPHQTIFPLAGGTSTVDVTTQNGCNWTAASYHPTQVHIDSGATGSGSGVVTFTFYPSSYVTGEVDIVVAGELIRLYQVGPCHYQFFNSNYKNVAATFGSYTADVQRSSLDCIGLTAVSNDPWITVTGINNSFASVVYVSFWVEPNTGAARTGTITTTAGTFTVYQAARSTLTHLPFDFDGDSKSDIGVFRNGTWYVSKSSDGSVATSQWGIATDKIVPGDYDGDGKSDYAVFRDGFWYILTSQGIFQGYQWGSAGDIPVPADYDGDGKTDLGVFRNGTWYLLRSINGSTTKNYGLAGDIPVVADYDGDGKADLGVFRNGTWYISRSIRGETIVQWGIAGDKPVVGDYDFDGKADYAVFRNGYWYFLNSTTGFQGSQWGASGDIPVPADYDGDGKTDLAVFRNGVWYIQRTTAGVQVVNFGLAGDKPIPNAFVP